MPHDIGLKKYRKKPLVIEAVQIPIFPTGSTPVDRYEGSVGQFVDQGILIAEWANTTSHLMVNEDEFAFTGAPVVGPYIEVTTAHGDKAYARPGDWLTPDSEPGTFYPIKPDVFERTYDVVDDGDDC